MVKNIPVYKLQTMNLEQKIIKTIVVDTDEFNGQNYINFNSIKSMLVQILLV